MKFAWMVIVSFVLTGSGCTSPQSSVPDLLKTATIKDIMDSMVDPSGDFMFESVVEIADANGITHKAPQTDEEWEQVRHRALILLEAPNLLIMEGRKVARPGEKSKNPEVELQPEQIQELLDRDRAGFVRRARRLQDAAAMALKAIDAKDKDALFHSIENIDKACENCHLQYWYPNDKRAQEAASKSSSTLK
jgi:Cytochrome C'